MWQLFKNKDFIRNKSMQLIFQFNLNIIKYLEILSSTVHQRNDYKILFTLDVN
jgi:hypothetical protein